MCLFSRATKLNIQLEWGRSITNKVNLDTLNVIGMTVLQKSWLLLYNNGNVIGKAIQVIQLLQTNGLGKMENKLNVSFMNQQNFC